MKLRKESLEREILSLMESKTLGNSVDTSCREIRHIARKLIKSRSLVEVDRYFTKRNVVLLL